MSFRGLRLGVRQRGPRLTRRHPNGDSDGILDGPTPLVRPDLRRYMAGIPKISVPQERESRYGTPGRNVFLTGAHSLREPKSLARELAET
jgi:hypothetical protein